MGQARTYKALGIAMLVLGALIVALSFSGRASSLRIGGTVLAFFGIVLLAQARRLN